MDNTKVYNLSDDESIEQIIKEVTDTLKEKGYDPINQLVGYLMSNDPGYITNYKNARNKITMFETSRILEVLVRNFIK